VKMNKKEKLGKVVSTALRLLKYRPRSREELRQALISRGFNNDEIKSTVSYLEDLGYINDVRFMESWCYYRREVSPRGRWLVKRELLAKGIAPESLEKYFDQYYPLEAEEVYLRGLIARQLAKVELHDGRITDEDRKKLMLKLYRKGFDRWLVNQLAEEAKK
jgi:regulatory protein